MLFLSETTDDELILSADGLNIIRWFVDTAFAVHPDFKSHTAGAMTLGRGCILNRSRNTETQHSQQHRSQICWRRRHVSTYFLDQTFHGSPRLQN